MAVPQHAWRKNALIAISMVALACFFLLLCFHESGTVGPAFSSQSGRDPARLWHRIIFGFVGVAAIYIGVKIVVLSR
jgi:hypothetical protein